MTNLFEKLIKNLDKLKNYHVLGYKEGDYLVIGTDIEFRKGYQARSEYSFQHTNIELKETFPVFFVVRNASSKVDLPPFLNSSTLVLEFPFTVATIGINKLEQTFTNFLDKKFEKWIAPKIKTDKKEKMMMLFEEWLATKKDYKV